MTEEKSKLSFSFVSQKDDVEEVFLVIDGRTVDKLYLDHVTLVAVAGLAVACIDVLPCNCGVAGCAGYHDPLIIETGEDTVTWYCPDTCADHLGMEKAVFDKAEYLSAIEDLQSGVEERHKQGKNFVMLGDYEYDEEDREILIQLDPTESVKLSRAHYSSAQAVEFAA
jgi:hypothetical protein